ncbi:MAG: NAD(P)/FAD-dependent oxidoreductase [Candidatus Hydrogenedentota bacterium]
MSLPSNPDPYDAIIIGGGAAGLMCALKIGESGKRALLLEHNDFVGKKIRISGGGRCNFTNINTEPSRFISENPRFCYSALSRYTPHDFISFVESHKIAYHEKKLGQLFCDESAQLIIDALRRDCKAAKVEIRTGCSVRSIEKHDTFNVSSNLDTVQAPALVIATGGLSIAKLGASSFGYRIAEQFDIPIIPTRPGLVPLILNDDDLESLSDLSGTSFNATVSTNKTTFEENVLITHRGLSGPAILQISSYRNHDAPIAINLFPGRKLVEELFQLKSDEPRLLPKDFLARQVTTRFAQRLSDQNDWSKPLGEMTDKKVRTMAEKLQRWTLPIAATQGYSKAEVTCGGVDTRALSPKTIECKSVPGLYFIGEVVDVTGWLGGYNFQWAWSSAYAAASSIAPN